MTVLTIDLPYLDKLRPIREDSELDNYMKCVDALYMKANRTPEEADLAEVICALVDQWTTKKGTLNHIKGIDLLREMAREPQGLLDLEKLVPNIAQILDGSAQLTVTDIQLLSNELAVTPAIFFEGVKSLSELVGRTTHSSPTNQETN